MRRESTWDRAKAVPYTSGLPKIAEASAFSESNYASMQQKQRREKERARERKSERVRELDRQLEAKMQTGEQT
ncbi:hypothetical protein BCV70DRAFT_196969, partial [Testicularia cyperi]